MSRPSIERPARDREHAAPHGRFWRKPCRVSRLIADRLRAGLGEHGITTAIPGTRSRTRKIRRGKQRRRERGRFEATFAV